MGKVRVRDITQLSEPESDSEETGLQSRLGI